MAYFERLAEIYTTKGSPTSIGTKIGNERVVIASKGPTITAGDNLHPSAIEPRVVHVVPQLFHASGWLIGGAERYALELARHMSSRVTTRLISFGSEEGEKQIGDLHVRILRPTFLIRGQVNNPVSIRALGEVGRADILHVHQTHIILSELIAALGRFVRTPVFTTDLGGGGSNLGRFFPTSSWFKGHLHISEYSRRIYGHADSPRARVILGGVDSTRFVPGRGGGGVLYVGRVLPHKGIDTLIRALPKGVPLLIAGPETHDEYSKLLRQLARGKQVAFAGPLMDEGLVETYGQADVIVLPSVYRDCYGSTTVIPELLGQTLLEGMSAGLPAIATTVASLPEVVADGLTGLLVPPGEPVALETSLRALLSDAVRAKKMGAAGRERALQHFSWKSTVDRCLAAYAELGGTTPLSRVLNASPLAIGF